MDSIKKKMQSLANETSSAVTRFERWEREVTSTNATADHLEEQVKAIQKKIQQTESAFDVSLYRLFIFFLIESISHKSKANQS